MPAPLVIDAGVALRTLLPNAGQEQARELVDTWQRRGQPLLAPSLWLYEITSAISRAVHFKALTEDEGRRALDLALRLGVQLILPDASLATAAYAWTRRLRRAAAYDSFYLALAETLGCEFWTVDGHLAEAANVGWVHTPRTGG